MLVIHQGSFGLAVGQALSQRAASVRLLEIEHALAHPWEGEDKDLFVAFALGSLHPNLVRRLSQTLWALGLAHSLALLSDQSLMIGPSVQPQLGPCLHCALARNLSMADTSKDAVLERNRQLHMERARIAEIPGYLPTLVNMAAIRLLQHSRLGLEHRGEQDFISLNNSWTLRTRIYALHGCICRGEKAPHLADRWTSQLEQDLKDVFSI